MNNNSDDDDDEKNNYNGKTKLKEDDNKELAKHLNINNRYTDNETKIY